MFSLLAGGVLLVASSVMGADHDADHDLDQGDGGHGDDAHHGDAGGFAAMFLSLRFWTFFAAFFGLTGWVMDGMDLLPGPLLPLLAATGMGGLSGYSAVSLIRLLGTQEVGQVPGAHDYVGKSARVLVPFERGALGKVRLELHGATVDVLATTDEVGGFRSGETALIIEMEGTTAQVVRAVEARQDDGAAGK